MATQTKAIIPRKKVEFDGQVHALAVVGPGRSVPSEEKVKIAALVCEMYATDRFPLEEVLKHCGVNSTATWYAWGREFAEIATLYKQAEAAKAQIYTSRLRERARTQAERLIDGYVVETVTKEAEATQDKNGNPIMATTRITKKEVLVRPSARLIEYALNNTDGNNFRRNPDPDNDFDGDVNIPPIEWVD